MRKKKGFGLVYVVIFFGMFILGIFSLVNLSLHSAAARRHYANERKEHSISENLADKAYNMMARYVEMAVNYSAAITESQINEIIESDLSELEKIGRELAEGAEYDDIDDERVTLYEKDGTLNEGKLKEKREEIFLINYWGYFSNEYGGVNNLFNMISDIENIGGEDISQKTVVLNKDALASVDFTAISDLDIVIQGQVNSKKIKSVYTLEKPEYYSKKRYPSNYHNIWVNPLMEFGIVANKKLQVQGDIRVSGGMYVKGDESGSVFLTKESAYINVQDGNLIACKGVEYDYNIQEEIDAYTAGAALNIDKGNLYAENILVQGRERIGENEKLGAQGARMNVSGDIFVHDDLQIDGEYAKIFMENYYGVSDGSRSDNNVVDNSSSIIINSDIIGSEGTEIDVQGKMILAGTSYIENIKDPTGEGETVYQTGESVSFKGNYLAYSEDLKDEYVLEHKSLGEVDLKYGIGHTFLEPLTLATYFRRDYLNYAIYNTEDKKIIIQLEGEFGEKYIDAEYFRPQGTNELVPIGEIEEVESSVFDLFNDTQNLIGDFLTVEESLIETVTLKKVENQINAFLINSEDKRYIKVFLTTLGKTQNSIRRAKFIKNDFFDTEDSIGEIGKFIPVRDDSVLSSDVVFNMLDRNQIELSEVQCNIELYDDVFNNLEGIHKSILFKAFYDDYEEEQYIKGTDGMSIGNISESVYSGAIISQSGVGSSNYYDDPLNNERKIRYMEDVLKDKIFYMDLFERQYKDQDENPYEDKNLDQFGEDLELYESLIGKEMTPRNTVDYMVTPEMFIKEEANEISALDLNGEKIYMNFNPEGVIITDNTQTIDSSFQGDVLRVDEGQEGVILIGGDLWLKGHVEINGTIIVLGNIYVDEGSHIEVNYDVDVVKNILKDQLHLVKKVFKEHLIFKSDKKGIVQFYGGDETYDYIPIKLKKWVVVQ